MLMLFSEYSVSATAIRTVQCLAFSVFVCVYVCVHTPVSYSAHVEVRAQLVLFHRESTRGWTQVTGTTTEPLYQPMMIIVWRFQWTSPGAFILLAGTPAQSSGGAAGSFYGHAPWWAHYISRTQQLSFMSDAFTYYSVNKAIFKWVKKNHGDCAHHQEKRKSKSLHRICSKW